MAIGVAAEQAVIEHFESEGWTVSCPVRNNSDRLVRAAPGFLVNERGKRGLQRPFVHLADATPEQMASGSPAFLGKRHAVLSPDLRLDKPGDTPRLVEVKAIPWIRSA